MRKDCLLPMQIAGLTFKNPFYVASGPTTRTVKQLLAIEKAGWAAASLKLSISPAPYINRYPRYALFPQYDALGFTAEKRLTLEEGLELMSSAKKQLHDLLLMANITYAGDLGPEGWVTMAKQFQQAGADIIELNMCCPNMSFNVQTTAGDKNAIATQTGASLGKEADAVAEIVRAIQKEITIPLFVKLTPEGGEIANVAKAAYEAGADAVGGTGNRLGIPPIDLENPGKSTFHLQQELGMTCLCGGWLKPLAQRDTYEIRKVCGSQMPIMATGGIRTAQDALEMAMCGGDLMGICAETLIRGYDFVDELVAGCKEWLFNHGYESLKDIRDQIVPQVKSAPDLTLYKGYAKVVQPGLTAPCVAVCPKGVAVQAVLKEVSLRNYEKAISLDKGTEECAGCTAPCQKACLRGRADSGLRIKEIMLLLREKAKESGLPIPTGHTAPVGNRVIAKAADVLPLRAPRLQTTSKAIATLEQAVEEAARCLRCGCGEGCALCAEICCEFAILQDDIGQVHVQQDKCVGCGMCFNRCPNKNIEMVNTGQVL